MYCESLPGRLLFGPLSSSDPLTYSGWKAAGRLVGLRVTPCGPRWPGILGFWDTVCLLRVCAPLGLSKKGIHEF